MARWRNGAELPLVQVNRTRVHSIGAPSPAHRDLPRSSLSQPISARLAWSGSRARLNDTIAQEEVAISPPVLLFERFLEHLQALGHEPIQHALPARIEVIAGNITLDHFAAHRWCTLLRQHCERVLDF